MQSAEKKIETYTPTPGDVVVLRGLRVAVKGSPNAQKHGPKIGRLVRAVADGRWFVKLYQPSPFRTRENYARLGRLVDLENIDRLATQRERTIGAVIALEAVRP
jgi:hypothetical protein